MSNHTLRDSGLFQMDEVPVITSFPANAAGHPSREAGGGAVAAMQWQAAHHAAPAVATEVARRRILRGDYGELTPKNNHVKAAGDDLGLSERQRQELRKQHIKHCPLEGRREDVDAVVSFL